MAAPTSTNEVTARKLSASISALWTKIKSTFQTLGNLVTSWGSTPSDTKYPSEKLVKTSLDAKVSAREEQVATVQDLIQSVRVKPGGSVGSAYLTSASTVSGFSIPSAWYNYIWVPHRDGSASSDNQKYGTLILTPLTNTPDVYVIEGGALAGSSPTYKAIKLANNTDARTISQDVSKGANLVVNGSGRMASGYNFSGFLYIPSISNGGSAGSFGFVGTTPIDEFISCDFNKKIVFSADIKNLVAQPSNCVHRIYVAEYDIDKNIINAAHVMFGVGTLTELTQDLNTGDTVVHLADLSGSNWIASQEYQRGFIFWNYKNSYNYLYPPETYSRNVYIGSNNTALYENANVNVSAGTITLNNAWTGPKIVAGTKVSRRQAGVTYPYPAQAYISDTNWHTIKGALKGITAPGTSERGAKFSQGTAFIKVGVYPTNASNTDETTGKKAVVTNFFVYEEQDINDAIGTLPVANGGTGKSSVTAGNYLVGNGTSSLTEKTPNTAANDLINALSTGDATPTGEDYYVAQFAGGGTTTKTYHRRPVKALWEYIKAQISSVLGLTATSYGGNAATATTAQNYNTSTGTIKNALDGKRDIYGDFYVEGTSIYGWKIGRMALGTGGSANGYMTAIVRIDRWTKLDNGDRDFDSFFGVIKLWARNSSDGTTTWSKASIHSFKPTAFTSTSRGYAIFKKSSNSGHTIDWYVGLAPDSDSTYTPKKEIAYSLIEISPMYEVNFTRGLERVASDPGFDSWMDNCTREPWLAHDQYGVGSSSLPVYVNADNKVVGVDPKLTQGNLIRSLDVWSNINDTDEYVPAANNSATAPYPHGRYSFAKIWTWIKGKLTSDSGVDISGNAATASDAKSGSTLATTLSGKAPTNHASSRDTYGKGTESNYGHVKLDNSALSASSTNTDGVACGKGHTHSQYLTSHQSISGKMNTSADNAASGALQNLTAQLNEGTSDFTDGTELFSSYAGNSGFGTTGYVNTPYRRKASSMWNYINRKLVIERSPADVGTDHKRIQLGYGSYGSGVVGYCCYLVHIYFNIVGGTLAGKGVTVLVSYDWRETTYQNAKCQVLNDNSFSDTGYRIVLANFLSDNNTKLHICLGLVNTSAPTTLVGFAYSYCKIMRVGYGLNWTESIASDNVGTYNYLVQSTYFMETDTNNKIKVVTALPSSPDSNTIYFV